MLLPLFSIKTSIRIFLQNKIVKSLRGKVVGSFNQNVEGLR